MPRTDDMLPAFDKFVTQINDAYEAARERLERGDMEGCQSILARISITHARTSMSMRSVLIRRGLMKGDDV